MSSLTADMPEMSVITPRQTIRGHTSIVQGVVHLPGGQHIITCSFDGSLRQWDLESGAQIDREWRDEGDAVVVTIALSPKGNTVVSGSGDGTVRLWDIETGKVITKWVEHTCWVQSVCWSPDGERVVSGSRDGTARVWDVESGEPVLGLNPIKTGHEEMYAVSYSPNGTTIATGGHKESGIKIWNAITGDLLSTIKHEDSGDSCWSLAWTSDQKKLISGSVEGSITIFDTATWRQLAILEGHHSVVTTITLSQNDRLLVSTSWDKTARLWNLDTNLPVGPALWHEDDVNHAALSADGKILVTCCGDNAYVWDIHAILKEAGLKNLLSMLDVSKNKLKLKSLLDVDATRRLAPNRLPRGFFDAQDRVHSSAPHHLHPHHLAPSSGSRPHALIDRMFSLFRSSQPNTEEATELQQRPRSGTSSRRSPPIVEVAAVRDKQALYVARRPERASDKAKHIKDPTLWARVVLWICCVSTQNAADGH